jgi:hypothetical protein
MIARKMLVNPSSGSLFSFRGREGEYSVTREQEDPATSDEQAVLREWHRLFGLLLSDYFTGTPFTVEIERDLSQQQQFLDVVILRRRLGRIRLRLPDGMEDLAPHNLLTFKSLRETLDAWAMKELIGHYVAYRKLVSPSPSELLPEEQFQLYAVCARFPHNLSGQVPWQEQQPGVYDCQWGTDRVRVIVTGQLPVQAHNAPLHLFSASSELVNFGRTVYRPRSASTSLLLRLLKEGFREGELTMSFTIQDFEREFIARNLARMTPEQQRELVEGLPPKARREMVKALSMEARREMVQELSPEVRQEIVQALTPEQRLAGLSPEQIQRYLDELTASRPTPSRKPRRKS